MLMKSLVLLHLLAALLAAQAPKTATVLDGVYTAAQADRGKTAFAASCAVCHRADLGGFSGPPLKGRLFMDRWREFPSSVLYDLIRTTMPKDADAPLPEVAYLDIFSYLLRENEIPAGNTDLTPAVLGQTLLVGRLGPQPLPTSAQVGVVGCLRLEVGTGWFLTKAGEPFRTLDTFDFQPNELEEAKTASLGDGLFRLQGITDLPDLDLQALDNKKVEVKGILARQTAAERVNVHAIKLVGPACEEV